MGQPFRVLYSLPAVSTGNCMSKRSSMWESDPPRPSSQASTHARDPSGDGQVHAVTRMDAWNELLFENVADAIFVYDLAGRILDAVTGWVTRVRSCGR